MIPIGEGFYYLELQNLCALLRGIMSKHVGDFYCLNCPSSFRAKNKPESHKKLCKNKDFCGVAMPSEDTKIFEFNHHQESGKTPSSIIYDLESLIKRID